MKNSGMIRYRHMLVVSAAVCMALAAPALAQSITSVTERCGALLDEAWTAITSAGGTVLHDTFFRNDKDF